MIHCFSTTYPNLNVSFGKATSLVLQSKFCNLSIHKSTITELGMSIGKVFKNEAL